MFFSYFPQNSFATDLYIVQLGMEKCSEGHSFGPAVRKNILIHYIYEGSGFFEAEGKTYNLSKGQAFVIFPNQITFYKADSKTPWEYAWVEIGGEEAKNIFSYAGVTKNSPIIKEKAPYVLGASVLEIKNVANKSSDYKLTGLLWFFIDKLISICVPNPYTPIGQEYVNKALGFIDANYWQKPTVYEISKYIGIDRSYLNKLFKEYVGISPTEYIIKHKMKLAEDLLLRQDLTIGDVSRSVGYNDQFTFSKAFKKFCGLSPMEWRKKFTK